MTPEVNKLHRTQFLKRARQMIAMGALLLTSSIPFVYSISCSDGSETVVVDRKFHNREIKVRVGGAIRVDLEELGTAGYAWMLENLDSEHFRVLKTESRETQSPSNFTGAPVVRTWLIQPKTVGKSALRFLHYRLWEGEKSASDTFVLKVRIIP